MKITDETLSAFLDSELSPSEMLTESGSQRTHP